MSVARLTHVPADLDARIPAITVEAASSKRRRRDVQPIRPELAARLRTWLSQRERTTASLRLRDNTAEESAPSENDYESPPSINEKTPVWQGFEDDCGLVLIAENPEPPVRLELTTYALRKHRSGSVNSEPDEGLHLVPFAGCTNGCTREPENHRGCTLVESATKPVDAELSKVMDAWPTLPEYLKAAVLALVATVGPKVDLSRQDAADAKR